MRRLASRGARAAAFFIDVLLVSLLPAALFYPLYGLAIPKEPKQPLLPLDLMTEDERQAFFGEIEARQEGIFLVLGVCAIAFVLAFTLYYTLSILRRGQT